MNVQALTASVVANHARDRLLLHEGRRVRGLAVGHLPVGDAVDGGRPDEDIVEAAEVHRPGLVGLEDHGQVHPERAHLQPRDLVRGRAPVYIYIAQFHVRKIFRRKNENCHKNVLSPQSKGLVYL